MSLPKNSATRIGDTMVFTDNVGMEVSLPIDVAMTTRIVEMGTSDSNEDRVYACALREAFENPGVSYSVETVKL